MKDIDDVLRSVGREAGGNYFKGLVAQATPAPEFLLRELKRAPEEKRSELADRFARVIIRYPPLEQENLRKRMAKALGTTARTVRDILSQARKAPAQKSVPHRRTHGQPSSLIMDDLRYRWTPAGLEKVEYREVEGQTVESSKVVANFLIRIERESEVIDDLRNHKELECRLLLAGRPEDDAGRSVRIEAAHFGSNHRLAEALAAAGHWEARCSSKHMDFVRMASSAYSGERGVARVKTVRYVGYAKSADGEDLGYITPSIVVRNGKVLPASEALDRGGLRCELPSVSYKSVKRLDLSAIDKEQCDRTLRHVIDDLIEFKGPGIGRCFVGHAFLAPVFGWLHGFKPYILALIGNSGLGKSTLAGYFQAFFGSGFTDLDLESWSGTPKAIELAGHIYKDALYVVDDFKLGHFSAGTLRDAMRVLQGYADGAGRNRLSRASTMMPSAYIRGMLAITGEDLPEGETSNLARIVPLRVRQEPVTTEITAIKHRCDEMRSSYSGVMARYIAWTQGKGADYVQTRARELNRTFADDPEIARVVADNKARVLQNLTLNMLGFVLWAEFTGESGVLDGATAGRMVQEHYEFLRTVFHEHVAVVSEERPFVLFLQHVRAMIESDTARLAPIRVKQAGGYETDPTYREMKGPLIGYRDGQHVYLLMGPTFKELGEYRARGRMAAGDFSKRTIMQQLKENDVLVLNPTKSGTNDVKKHRIYVDGSRLWVVKIAWAKFEAQVG